jgi:hypothetical protein
VTFVILTSKPGQFRTELGEHLREIEAYDYLAQGRNRAHFVIAEVVREAKIRVIDEGIPPVVNTVPSKFFPRFDTIEKARQELGQLARSGPESRLVRL